MSLFKKYFQNPSKSSKQEEPEKSKEKVNKIKENFDSNREDKKLEKNLDKDGSSKNPLKETVDFLAGKEENEIGSTYIKGFFEYASKAWKDEKNLSENRGTFSKITSIWSDYQEAKSRETSSLNVYEKISESAALNSEFLVLLAGSTLVATFGLLQNSTAVIIGAMIIAPLMMPILGFALASIWGDFKLLFRSILTLLIGASFAIGISALISFIIPGNEYNNEILARTGPNLFDVFIALASGFVGAYAYVSPMISSSMSGVAIAVALMPPLCTVGITLGNQDVSLSLGALLLFLINIVGIALASSFVFWRQRIHPVTDTHREVKLRAVKQIVFASVFLIALSIPVTWFMFDSFKTKRESAQVTQYITENIKGVHIESCQMKEATYKSGIFECVLVIPSSTNKNLLRKVQSETTKMFHKKIEVHFIPLPLLNIEGESEN